MTILKNLNNTNDLLNISTESFICEGVLYNASYIPTDDSIATIMLEKVVKYSNENIYYKNRINMITITINNSSEIKLSSFHQELSSNSYELALAAATAAYKFDLVKNYLTVDMNDESLPIHINLSNR